MKLINLSCMARCCCLSNFIYYLDTIILWLFAHLYSEWQQISRTPCLIATFWSDSWKMFVLLIFSVWIVYNKTAGPACYMLSLFVVLINIFEAFLRSKYPLLLRQQTVVTYRNYYMKYQNGLFDTERLVPRASAVSSWLHRCLQAQQFLACRHERAASRSVPLRTITEDRRLSISSCSGSPLSFGYVTVCVVKALLYHCSKCWRLLI